MLHKISNGEEDSPDQYLRNISERFFLDTKTGIYKPKAYDKQNKSDSFKKFGKIWAPVILNALTLFFVIRYTHYARLQWGEMKTAANAARDSAIQAKNANDITKQELVELQRAFVFPGDPKITPEGKSIDIYLPIENSGTTPTREMRMHVSYLWMATEFPKDFQFPDIWEAGQPHINRRFSLAPKGQSGEHLLIPVDIALAVFKRQIKLQIWGWARYNDIFDGTPQHITKFCYEVTPQDSEVNSIGPLYHFTFNLCDRHNCYDEECKK